ncbi:hypothetical protein STRMA_1259 [Streptococcus macacae NCTC 11558]|uniref:Uncharacterized protein n=1 Tax=Streptococcus macacae NCTC 11558 TaxID=764298 RepID=G5JXA4_9STRE|nr:hypothetical protein STRMA_1259 [Streptococcus macacae NCTC 11558]
MGQKNPSFEEYDFSASPRFCLLTSNSPVDCFDCHLRTVG